MLAMKLPSLLIMATALLLMGTLVPFVLALPANPAPTQAVNLEGGQFLRKNTQLLALPESCTTEQKKWQPAMDFDKDGCYNTPFINIQGKLAEGLSNWYTDPAVGCRNASYLDNNNVYVRSRCNNGWCAHMYAYYFEKDVYVADFADPAGKQHSFQHIVVYVEQKTGQAKQVSLTCGTINPPSNYQFNCHADDQSRSHFEDLIWQMGWDRLFWDNDTHIKVVYHKEGGLGHRFRFAKRNEAPENHKNKWFYGQLVDWDTMPKNLTTILNKHTWPPGVAFGIPDGLTATAKDKIDKEEQAEIKFGTPPNDHKTLEEQHKYEDTIFSEWLRRSNWWHKDLGRFNPNGTYYLGGATHEGDDTAMKGPDS